MKKYYFIFCNESILLEHTNQDGVFTIPISEEPPIELKPWTTMLNGGPLKGIETRSYRIDSPDIDSSRYELCPLRQSYYKLPEDLYLKAGKYQELHYWDKNTKYCGVCGGTMSFHTDISKRCTECGKEVWPQLATAIIVLISRGEDELLLAQGRNFKSDFYGLIAGFVETGETLEDAVKREVKEETGLSVKNIRYFDSQPWPYPCGLMVGFYAEYESGDIKMQREELKHVAWFHRSSLPKLPEKLSIARRLIDNWLNP